MDHYEQAFCLATGADPFSDRDGEKCMRRRRFNKKRSIGRSQQNRERS